MKRAALLLALFPGVAAAQPGRPPPPIPLPPGVFTAGSVPGRPPSSSPVREAGGDLGRHFGVRVAERLLASSDPNERIQGVQRLAAIGTPQALDLLIRSQEPGSLVARDLRARLAAVRSLGPFLAQDEPRQVVVRALVDGATLASGSDSAELAGLLRDTAAMVLGSHGGARGSDALAGLLRQGGSVATAAARALAAYPPARLDALVGVRAPGTVALVELLATLGDLRAIPFLRQSLRGGEPAVRAASLLSLAALGDGEAPLVAREWAREADPLPKMAAVRALLRSAPPEGRAALAPLLRDPALRRDALAAAIEGPGPELAAPLAALVADPSLDDASRSQAIEALGRSGGSAAASALELLLASPRAHEAALALALSPGKPARQALERALRSPALRASALRAAAVRALVLRDAPAGLFDAADDADKGSPAERAAAVFARVALGKRDLDDALLNNPELVGAAARGALARGPEALDTLLAALERTAGSDKTRREALALGLLARPDGGKLSSGALVDWVEEGSAAAPLAARALAMRDDEATRPRLARLLRGGAPQLRAHVALGLARSPSPDATGRLVDAYPFETDPQVRRALLRALSLRTEPLRQPTLELAAALDPDPTARALARAALAGRPASEQGSGDLVAWLRVDGASGPTALRWERPDGLALPVVSDPDGALLVPGLPAAPSRATVPPAAALTTP